MINKANSSRNQKDSETANLSQGSSRKFSAMEKIPFKIPGSGSSPKSNGLLLRTHPSPPKISQEFVDNFPELSVTFVEFFISRNVKLPSIIPPSASRSESPAKPNQLLLVTYPTTPKNFVKIRHVNRQTDKHS